MKYATKTELYQKVKKPQLERERRARINKCLDALKHMLAAAQGNERVLGMDKAELLEATIVHLRQRKQQQQQQQVPAVLNNSFKSGYINAANEVSRVLASIPGVSVAMGKTVMSHLGHAFNELHQKYEEQQQHNEKYLRSLTIDCGSSTSSIASNSPALSPASSGYHSDDCDSPKVVWRPW